MSASTSRERLLSFLRSQGGIDLQPSLIHALENNAPPTAALDGLLFYLEALGVELQPHRSITTSHQHSTSIGVGEDEVRTEEKKCEEGYEYVEMDVDLDTDPKGPMDSDNHVPNQSSLVYSVQLLPNGEYSWLIPKNVAKLPRHEIESYINEPLQKSGNLSDYFLAVPKAASYQAIEADEAETIHTENIMFPYMNLLYVRTNSYGVSNATTDSPADSSVQVVPAPSQTTGVPDAAQDKITPQTNVLANASRPLADEVQGNCLEGVSGNDSSESKEDMELAAKEARDGRETRDLEVTECNADTAGHSEEAVRSDMAAAKSATMKVDVSDYLLTDPEAMNTREWRHRLQKVFLSKGTAKPEDMPAMDSIFQAVEIYDMPFSYLVFSKIGKVMRHISVLPDVKVPRDDEFKFRDRAKALVREWYLILNRHRDEMTEGAAGANGNVTENTVVVATTSTAASRILRSKRSNQ